MTWEPVHEGETAAEARLRGVPVPITIPQEAVAVRHDHPDKPRALLPLCIPKGWCWNASVEEWAFRIIRNAWLFHPPVWDADLKIVAAEFKRLGNELEPLFDKEIEALRFHPLGDADNLAWYEELRTRTRKAVCKL